MARNDPLFEAWTPSRSLDAYLQSRAGQMQDPAWRQLLGVTPAALSEYAGAPGGTVRARERAEGYGQKVAAAEVLGPDIQTETSGPGIIQRAFDIIDRPRSAVLGFATGLDRLTRYADPDRGVEADIAGPNESGLQVGLRRAVESLRGEDNYRFQDFTNISRSTEASGGKRFGNAALGFVIDTVMDPITYLSFGGSILGRRNASEYIAAKTNSWVANSRSKAGSIIDAAFARPDFDAVKYVDNALASNSYDKTILVNQLNNQREALTTSTAINDLSLSVVKENVFNYSDDIADLALKSDNIRRATKTDLMREQARKMFPTIAANTYAAGNTKLLRRYVSNVMGKDFSDAYIKMLPIDIQGGIRLRIPFSKNAEGVPIAYKIPGIGAGQLSDKFKFIDKVTDMTERGRYALSQFFADPVLSKISGRNGEMWFDAVNETRGRLLRGKTGKPGVSYSQFMQKVMADSANRSFTTTVNRTISEEVTTFLNMYKNLLNQYSAEAGGERAIHRLFDEIVGTEPGWNRVQAAIKDGTATKLEEAVYSAGSLIRKGLDSYGKILKEEFDLTESQAVELINFYLPHHVTARQQVEASISAGTGIAGARVNPTKSRNRGLAGFTISKQGDISEIRWQGAVDANDWQVFRQEGTGDLFMENPMDYIPKYFAETARALEDMQFINTARKYGLFARAEMKELIDYDITLLRMQAAELFETDFTEQVKEVLGEAGRAIGEPRSIEDPRKLLDEALRRNRTSLDTIADQLRQLGVTIADRDEIRSAWRVVNTRNDPAKPFEKRIYRNSYLNATVKQDKKGRWYMYFGDKDTAATRYKGNRTGSVKYFDASNEAALLGSLAAEGTARNRLLAGMITTSLREATALQYWKVNVAFKELLATEPKFSKELLNYELLQRQGVPIEEQRKIIEQYVQQVHDVLELFGKNKRTQKTYEVNGKTVTIEEGIRVKKQVATESFRNFIAQEGLTNIRGDALSAAGGPGRMGDRLAQVKQRIGIEMENEYAPYATMAAISRKFRIMQDPETWGQRFIENFLKPFYAMNKVWMTLGRGPGFIIRNIQGGMWNLIIHDVGRVDTLLASRRGVAHMAARSRIKEKYGRKIFETEPATVAEEFKTLFREEMERFYTGTGTFIPGTKDIDAIMDMENAFLNQGMDASRLSARLAGEIMNSGRERAFRVDSVENGKRVTRWVYPTSDQVDASGKVIRSTEVGRTEQALRWLATENPWIHAVWGPVNDAAENFMRFSAFSKGVRDFGLESDPYLSGFSASLWTKWTQFDYSDLSDFERTLGKSVIPFWTWTRYNVPLVFRTVINRPGNIAAAIRVHESLGGVFAEEDEDGWPTSSFLKDRMGFVIPEEDVRNLLIKAGVDPNSTLIPQGDVGVGMFIGENVLDVNRFLRTPGEGGFRGVQSVFNTREIWQNGNPLLAGLGTLFAGAEGDPTVSMTDTEQAPGWLALMPGLRRDPVTGEKQVSRYATEATRTFFPIVRHLERYAPTVFGGEREPGRWFTSLASGIFGVPVSTEDDWKYASEMDRRSEFIRLQVEEKYGRSGDARMEMVKQLLENGAPMEFIQNLEIQDMADDEVDVANAVATWQAVQRINYLAQMGVPEEDLVAAILAYVPDDMEIPDDLTEVIYRFLPKPKLDLTALSNQFGLAPPTPEQLEAIGVTEEEVRQMSEQELQDLVIRLNPGRFTMQADQARYLEWLRTQDF